MGLALFGLVLVQLGLAQTWAALQGLDVGYIAAACAMFAISYVIKVAKWYWMQRRAGLHRSWVSVAHLYFGTRVGGLFTPLRSGEFVPGLVGDDKAAVLAITFFDRLIETSQTLLTFVVVFALFAYQFVAPAGLWPLALLFALVGLVCVPFLWPERTVRGLLGALDWLGRRAGLHRLGWFARLEALAQDHVARFFDIAGRFFTPRTVTGLLVVTLVGWVF
ncbi:MAG: flippase-like domain-containing protein, partial [Chloroflexi bacterium]|nr:flippase-like domain-containing protein [Chloroflexota bacterium]